MNTPGQSGNEPQPEQHQPDWARWEAEHGAHAYGTPSSGTPSSGTPAFATPPQRPAPVDVETARHLWWAVAALGFLGLLFTLITVNGEKSTFAQHLVDDVTAQDPSIPLTLSSAESYLTAALVVMALVGLGFSALFVYWVNKMRLGRMWARALLTMIGTITIVVALPQLFALGVDGGSVSLLAGVSSILQGVLAAGAIYLMHRRDSNAYFLASRKPRDT